MKKLALSLFAVCISMIVTAKNIVSFNDLQDYNPQKKIELMASEINFWSGKLTTDQNNPAYLRKLAVAYDAQFKLTGNISDLKNAEKYISQSIKNNKINPAGGLRAMAQNLISQHRFCEALDYALEAESLVADLRLSQMVLFDIYMELGDDEEASQYLSKIQRENDFNYIIRKAKWEDGQGNLDKAIQNLEKAILLAENSNNFNQLSWLYSNIADFYGHDGQIQKSKAYYLKALKLDNSDWYAVNKLAWIAWSHDGNPDLALTIINDIKLFNASPSLDILKAKILRHEGRRDAAKQLEDSIAASVSSENYAYMYVAFLNNYLLTEGDFSAAIALSTEEIGRRPSIESYVLLMNCYYAKGDLASAKKIAQDHLIGKTSEPPILIDVLRVLGDEDIVKNEILQELKNCAFELGPLRYSELKRSIS